MAIGSSQWMYSSGDYELEQSLRFEATRGTTMSWQAASRNTSTCFFIGINHGYWIFTMDVQLQLR